MLYTASLMSVISCLNKRLYVVFVVLVGVSRMNNGMPSIEWERYRYTLPKSKAEVEIIREIVMNNDDLDHMDMIHPN